MSLKPAAVGTAFAGGLAIAGFDLPRARNIKYITPIKRCRYGVGKKQQGGTA